MNKLINAQNKYKIKLSSILFDENTSSQPMIEIGHLALNLKKLESTSESTILIEVRL